MVLSYPLHTGNATKTVRKFRHNNTANTCSLQAPL
nr:MAG TPA: hypothetical protein [Caudoviricetes sp.]